MEQKSTNDTAAQSGSNKPAENIAFRIDNRRREGESREDVINRCLDETVESVTLEEVTAAIEEEFDEISCVRFAAHVPIDETGLVIFTVHTPEAFDFDEREFAFGTDRYRLVFPDIDGLDREYEFGVEASEFSPGDERLSDYTHVYRADHFESLAPLTFAEGLESLRTRFRDELNA
ncbi:hypothetical protein [Halovivax gelatinilyticus]|uniref:hypothetical protein n=1 Tax=Halovivax gelatinilyticus TaxID=2961597 RepID=UPI0020CA8C25|nr:hypothetical protein [Halovivax gelatinilyticus]